ncbi:MAG TPA: caspase family protein [Planctomycetota bacterium]|nr:caspase family protein [Planctomycetota bacterium]
MENASRSSLYRAALSAASLAAAVAVLAQAALPQGSTPAVAPLTPGVASPGCLALIVGIDDYAQPDDASNRLSPLRGACNDAARAKELLLGRFGFAAGDIVTLLGPAATHEAIVRSFYEHLIARAGPQTRVVIWFSGHGSRVPDTSKADAAVRNEFDAPWDDTLLAHDSRTGKRDGSYDITDDELHSLLAALRAKDVVLVTDCCHSGGLLRGPRTGGVRHASAGTQSLDRESIRSFWPEAVPFLDDDRGSVVHSTVHIAACESTQQAGECEGAAADRWYGTLTWFLTSALAEVDPATSWQTVAEIVRARVAACRSGTRADQIVCCVGPGDRAIFGGLGKPVPIGYQAHPHGARCRIEAGRIHGLVEDSQLRLVGLDDKDYGLVRVYRARATFCEAEPLEGRRIPAGVALRAVPHQGLEGRAALRINCATGVDPAVLEGCPWVVNTPREAADYVLATRGDGLALQTLDGAQVRDVPASPQRAQQELFAEHCFRSLWEGVAQPGRHRIRIAVKPWDAARAAEKNVPLARVQTAGERRVLVGAPFLPVEEGKGAMVTLTVTNESTELLHIAVLSVAEDRAVNVIWGRDSNNVLAGGRSESMTVELGPNPKWPHDRPMVDRYLVIATPRYADFRPFESRAPEPTRGRLDTGAMPAFLAGALTGSTTRGGNEQAAPPAWGIQWLDLELVLPDRFDSLTRN